MWRNYLTVGYRALTKNRTYAFINIAGLAIGLAACLLILLYVRYETSYDSWLPDAERVYQVQSIYTDPETGEVSRQQGTHGVIAAPMAKDFPQIEAITRADSVSPVFMRGGEATFAPMIIADEGFFKILQVPFLHGDPATVLKGMDSLVLSRSEALRRFGGINVVGQTVTAIRRGEQYGLRVTGVFEDIPRNSHLNLTMVGRMSDQDAAECGWGCVNGTVYLKLKPGADPEEIHRQMPSWEKRNIPPSDVGGVKVSEGDAFDWRLTRVTDVHLSGAEGEPERPGNDRRTIVTFSVVALLILAMATVNFVNLATARASQRAREVALRKVLGANRRQLIVQFLGESILLTGVALLLALALVELLLPSLSAFLDADLSISYFGAGGVLLPAIGLLLLVGLAGRTLSGLLSVALPAGGCAARQQVGRRAGGQRPAARRPRRRAVRDLDRADHLHRRGLCPDQLRPHHRPRLQAPRHHPDRQYGSRGGRRPDRYGDPRDREGGRGEVGRRHQYHGRERHYLEHPRHGAWAREAGDDRLVLGPPGLLRHDGHQAARRPHAVAQLRQRQCQGPV
jgi:putative ABC transport system permease protein